MDVFGRAMQSSELMRDAALVAAHELGVFEALARGWTDLQKLVVAIGVQSGQHRVRALLDALTGLGVIRRADAPDGEVQFSALEDPPPRPTIPPLGWGLLADVIRRDQPLPVERGADGDAERRLHHHLASAGAAAAAELAALLPPTSLLDLGAGAGAYSKAFLAACPEARATLVDTGSVLALAADWLGPLAARARFIVGDACAVDVGAGHGAVLLANLLHLHGRTTCRQLVETAARAVVPGGLVVIKDLRVDDDRSGPLEGLLFALNMAIYTQAGDVYATRQLRAWLAGAGLVDIAEHRLATAPEAVVVLGRRPRNPEPDRPDDSASGRASTASSTKCALGAMASGPLGEAPARRDDPSATLLRHSSRTDDSAEPAVIRDHRDVVQELDAALARTAVDAWRALVVGGTVRAEAAATPPALAFPTALRSFLAGAVAIERDAGHRGDTGAAERAEQLVRHYTDTMPRMRVGQLAGTDEPAATLFHAALDWRQLPRLSAALDRLYAVLAAARVDAAGALGAASADAFRARTPTLAALHERTHYGGFMPLLYGYPADLTYMQDRGAADGLDTLGIIDRYLTAPIVHELCHFAPGRPTRFPPHLDECIAGWLGVHVHPELAYPVSGDGDALYAAPWLSQVGQAIARAFGVANLVRAHAAGGDALPSEFVAAANRLGWEDWRARRTLHFLSDTFDPAPWVGLALAMGADRAASEPDLSSPAALPALALADLQLAPDPAFDQAIVEDALRAMCLTSTQIAGSFRTRTRLPDGAITIDACNCAVVAPHRGDLDPVVPCYWLPPAVAQRIAARGHASYQLQLASIAAIPAAAAAICEAAGALARDDFALSATPRSPSL